MDPVLALRCIPVLDVFKPWMDIQQAALRLQALQGLATIHTDLKGACELTDIVRRTTVFVLLPDPQQAFDRLVSELVDSILTLGIQASEARPCLLECTNVLRFLLPNCRELDRGRFVEVEPENRKKHKKTNKDKRS